MKPHESASPGLLSGTTVGHYEILEKVGAGGMGEVYRARDTRLKRIVAVKVQSENLARNSIARQRFIRETRLAAQVTHAFVATVFDVVEKDEDLLLVMEFIEGRTLTKVIRDDPAVPETRFRYGVEIGEGLNAIHKAGLVHRDLKPGNVMITADGHVKITDFGLAKRAEVLLPESPTVSVHTQLTQPGGVVGTALYMSPEQLRQEEIDQRSDLFSYGILLSELLTGDHPFARKSIHESISAILRDPPTLPELPPALTGFRALQSVLLKCLEKDPAKRYQTAEELLEDLAAAREQQLAPRRVFTPRRFAAYAIALLVLALLTGLWWINRPSSRGGPRIAVAFVPLQDRTGDAGESFRGVMAADLLAVELQSSSLVRAIGPDETASLVRSLPSTAEPQAVVSRILSGITTDYVALGSLYREGEQYVASLTLFPAHADIPTLQPLKVQAASIALLADALTWSIRRSLPNISTIAAWRDDRIDVEEITSVSDEARMLYERGSLALADGRLGEAVEWLQAATTVDPAFAMAHARLAMALRDAGYGRQSREAATKAIKLSPEPSTLAAERLALTLRAVRARVFARADDAVDAWGELAQRFPDEPAILELSARALDRAGRFSDALREVDQALVLDGLRASSYLAKAGILVRLNRGEDGLQVLDQAEEIYRLLESDEGLAEVDYLRGAILIELERFAEAQARLDEAARRFTEAGSEPRVAKVLLEAGKSDILRGEVQAAEAKLTRAYEIAQRSGNLGLIFRAKSFEGAQLYRKGDLEGAKARLEEAVDLGLQLENDWVVWAQGNLGSLLNYMGRLDEARTVLTAAIAAADELGRDDAKQLALRTLADIDYQVGDLDAAIGAYEQMIRSSADQPLRRVSLRPHQRLSQIYARRGEPDQALATADRAVQGYRELDVPGDLGYALLWRARAYGLLRRQDEARIDLAEARKIATGPDAGLADLEAKCDIAEATLAADNGQWGVAQAAAERAAEATSAGPPADRILALELLCRTALANSLEKAVERCTAAAELPRIPVADRVHAAALLSEALWRTEQSSAARQVATAAYQDAQRMTLNLPVARSAAVLVSLPGGMGVADTQEIRASGRRALSRFIESAVAAGGEDVRNRQEILWLTSVLEEFGAATSQDSKGGNDGEEG